MNEEYLWDKTGEPDPQIQELEEILGNLRYKPRPLSIPANLLVPRRRSFRPLIAIAATVLFALLAAGLWLSFTRNESTQPETARQTAVPTSATPEAVSEAPRVARDDKHKSIDPQPAAPKRRQNQLTTSKPRRSTPPDLKARENEALEAKAQLMLAFRLASEKLSLAQRKTQGQPQIRNQHKVG